MKSLRIAMINEHCTAGAERCARDLERHFSIRHTVRYYPRSKEETVDSLLADLAEFSPDLVHCHSYYGDLPYDFLATISHRYTTCFTPHDARPVGTMSPICWECPQAKTCFWCPLTSGRQKYFPYNPYFWQRLRKRIVHQRSAKSLTLVTPSQWQRQRFLTTELRRFAIHTIHNGIDLTHFRPISEARDRLELPQDRKLILYVAHPWGWWDTDPRKGLKYLAQAFVNMIVPQYEDAMLLVAGEYFVPNHPNVKPLGFLSQETLPLYYSAADVLAVPTLADNLPYTVLEAMGCGVPVVASNVGGIPEEVEDGVTGLLVPRADSEALGQALFTVLHDPHTRDEMGRAARRRAEQHFSMEQFVQRYEELYYRIVGIEDERNVMNRP